VSSKIETTLNWGDQSFDTIIDVRAPSEFYEDHIVGALNCPVLDDNQRVEIGLLYKKVSGFEAKVKGAIITARNIAFHIENNFSQYGGNWRPLIYCWRGGQRSRAMALVLKEIGWRPILLSGGHKQYRKDILKMIPELCLRVNIILISGQTGSAKTHILQGIKSAGGNILDLEALAKHRGSLLGAIPGETQPSQKYFESCLVEKLRKFSQGAVVFIESESSKIGNLHIPIGLWRAMHKAPLIEVKVPSDIRARFLQRYYSDLKINKDRFSALFLIAKSRVSSKIISDWEKFLQKKAWQSLALSLIKNYYDPAYLIHRTRQNRIKVKSLSSSNLTAPGIRLLATKVLEIGERYFS